MLNECIDFCNIDELKILKNISFSLQKIIELCHINDIRVKLFPPDQYWEKIKNDNMTLSIGI